MTINWELVRKGWMREARRWATKRNPDKCTCRPGDQQSGEWCHWCDDVNRYMRTMEDHADVVPVTTKPVQP